MNDDTLKKVIAQSTEYAVSIGLDADEVEQYAKDSVLVTVENAVYELKSDLEFAMKEQTAAAKYMKQAQPGDADYVVAEQERTLALKKAVSILQEIRRLTEKKVELVRTR